ncbi:transposase family protein, partial [Streptomyces wedmorensis]
DSGHLTCRETVRLRRTALPPAYMNVDFPFSIKAYQGAGGSIRVPLRGRRLKRWQRRHNTTHAKIRCLGEQTMATLKGRRLLRKLRCSTHRITAVVQAVLVLHHASA